MFSFFSDFDTKININNHTSKTYFYLLVEVTILRLFNSNFLQVVSKYVSENEGSDFWVYSKEKFLLTWVRAVLEMGGLK